MARRQGQAGVYVFGRISRHASLAMHQESFGQVIVSHQLTIGFEAICYEADLVNGDT